MTQTVELPEKIWFALQHAARARGVTPAGWIAAQLPAADEVEVADDAEPPTYLSVPLERVGAVQVECVNGKELAPLPYPLGDGSE